MNRETWVARQRILDGVRSFFRGRGIMEVETPSLAGHRDISTHILDFYTEFTGPDGARRTMGLITSPEHHMKRLLAQGWGSIFQICRFFRNGELSAVHNPEFTGVEWYEVGAGYRDCMDTTEALVRACAEIAGRKHVRHRGVECDLSLPFERLAVRDAVMRYAGKDIALLCGMDEMRTACEEAGERCAGDDSWEDMFFRLFLSKVEPHLGAGRPVFLCDYPSPMASLSVLRMDVVKTASGAAVRYDVAERFELYVAGVELCNGFTELRDKVEQRKRFLEQIEAKKVIYGGEYTIDEEFLEALPGVPPCAGNALGLDRLVMLLSDLDEISEVVAFPVTR